MTTCLKRKFASHLHYDNHQQSFKPSHVGLEENEWLLQFRETLSEFVILELITWIRSYLSPCRFFIPLKDGFRVSFSNSFTPTPHTQVYPRHVKYHPIWKCWVMVVAVGLYPQYVLTWKHGPQQQQHCEWLAGRGPEDPRQMDAHGHSYKMVTFQYINALEIDTRNGDLWLLDWLHIHRLRNGQVKTVARTPFVCSHLTLNQNTGVLFACHLAGYGLVSIAQDTKEPNSDTYVVREMHPCWLSRFRYHSRVIFSSLSLTESGDDTEWFAAETGMETANHGLMMHSTGLGSLAYCFGVMSSLQGLLQFYSFGEHCFRNLLNLLPVLPHDHQLFAGISCPRSDFQLFWQTPTNTISLLDNHADTDIASDSHDIAEKNYQHHHQFRELATCDNHLFVFSDSTVMVVVLS